MMVNQSTMRSTRHLIASLYSKRPRPLDSRRFLSSKQGENGFFTRAWMGWKHLTGQIPTTERQQVELHELRLALLSIHYRRLKEEYPGKSYEVEMQRIWKENERLKNIGMRYEVQVELAPDILELLETFDKVDSQLERRDKGEILMQDYEEALCGQQQNPEKAFFFDTKRGALEILLRHLELEISIPEKSLPWEMSGDKGWFELLDEFGYNGKDAPQEVYNAIRDHQAHNLARSFLIKQQLGYSVIALKSSIHNAGRGIFVDGVAPPGAIVAFFPGQVWPREYFINPAPDVTKFFAFETNPNFQLHFRGDDFLLDCRSSPYTVLENPWAVGHIANHAPVNRANSRSIGINFFEKMHIGANLWRYVPNEYAKPPTLMGGTFLDRESIEMHGLCLLNKRRDLANQEILYDYRLQLVPDEVPAWYEQTAYDFSGIEEQMS